MSTLLYRELARTLSFFVSAGGNESALAALIISVRNLGGALYNVAAQPLAITRLRTDGEVERIANDLEIASNLGPSVLRAEISGIFYELTLNAVQHSQSTIGGYATIQLVVDSYDRAVYVIGVADCGIGVPASLRQNPEFTHIENDADAISLATQPNITGTRDSYRGIGLDYVTQVVVHLRGNLIILSGSGYWGIESGNVAEKVSIPLTDQLSGTVATVAITVPSTG